MFFLAYHSQKIALLRREKNSITIEHLRSISPDVKPLYILNSILYGKRYETVTGLKTDAVLLRSLSLKLKSKREILAALPFQVENILPYSKEELILLPTLYPTKSETEIFLLASSKNTLQKHLEELNRIDFDPDIVSCVPLALFRFASHFFPKYPSLFIHYQGEAQHAFIVVKEGRLLASLSHKSQDFERTCVYMQKKYPEIHEILMTGKNLLSSPFNSIEVEDGLLTEYAIPIGLALDAAKKDTQSGQFRQKDSISKKFLRKRKKQLLGYFSSCVCFISLVLGMGHFYLRKQEMAILEALGSSKDLRLSQVVEQLEKSLSQKKKTSIPLPTIPKVHEVLTWLSTHPKLSEDCSIDHFRYEVVKAPKLGSQVKTYSAKIEMELSIPNSCMARAFHEALLEESLMIDQKNPVRWNADHGIYHTSFYLKPRQPR